jgi:hypothetical protein
MRIQNLTSKTINGKVYVSGTISISQDLFSRDNFGRTVTSYRKKYNDYPSVGKMDVKNMRFLHLNDMPLFDNQQEFKFYIEPKKIFLGTLCRDGIEKTIGNYSSSKPSRSSHLSWWEFGHKDEFFLKSLFLLPFRLIAYAIMIPFWFVRKIFTFAYRIVASIFVLVISIFILLPVKYIGFIITFGYWNGFKDRYIERLEDIWDY